MSSFSTGKLRKKLSWTNNDFFFFFNCSNLGKLVEKIVKQIGEKIWWILHKFLCFEFCCFCNSKLVSKNKKQKTKKQKKIVFWSFSHRLMQWNEQKKDPKANDYEKLVNLRNDLHSYWQRRKWMNQGCRNRYNLIDCRHKKSLLRVLKKGV